MKPPNVAFSRQGDLKYAENDLKLGKNDLKYYDLKWDFPLGGLQGGHDWEGGQRSGVFIFGNFAPCHHSITSHYEKNLFQVQLRFHPSLKNESWAMLPQQIWRRPGVCSQLETVLPVCMVSKTSRPRRWWNFLAVSRLGAL